MVSGTSSSGRRALAILLAWGATVVGLAGWAPSVAHAATVSVSFTMTALEVSGTESDDEVVLSGSITNTGDTPAYGVQVILWRSRDPIRDLPTLRKAGTDAAGWGSRLPISSDHYAVISTSTEAFAPGATRQVTLRSTLGTLGFDAKKAAYAFGADVIASDGETSIYRTVGQLRTFVALPGKDPVPLTRIVMLSARPTKLVDGLFANDDLASQLGSRLDALLTVAARPGMSWLIDPALLDEVTDMADGYQVHDGKTTRAGTGQQVAAAWLARFDQLDRSRGARTLFANPDVDGARVAGDQQVVARAELAADPVSRITGLPLIVVPTEGMLNQPSYGYLADAEPEAVIAANVDQAGALQAGAGEARVLAISAEVPGAAATPVIERRQLALAAAVIAGDRGQARLLTSLGDLAVDGAATADWLTDRELDELLAGEPAPSADFVATKSARLSKTQFGRIDRLGQDFAAYAELVVDSTLSQQADAARSRAASSAWAGDASSFNSYLTKLADLVGGPAVERGVRLEASPRFLMSARSNQFPITVTNDLSEAIRVRVVLTSDSPQRLTVPPSELITVAPGRSETVNVRPEATANGLVIARAHVATESGRRVTPDTAITIEVTDLGVVAWIIVGVSGLVLVGATAWRIRQVRRRTPSGEPEAAA